MNKTSKIALAILGAAAVGVVIGGLFYTDKGKEIREQIGSKASDAKDKFADLINRGKQKANETLTEIGRKANGLKSQAEEFVS